MFYLAKKLIDEGKEVTAILGFNKADEIFCKEDFEIHLFNGEEIKTFTLGELLPESFNL